MAPERTLIVGIAGPSGSGKTTVARRLAASLGAGMLSMESYYRDLSALPLADRERHNFDSPEALDAALSTLSTRNSGQYSGYRVAIDAIVAALRINDRTMTAD